ncbi:MAG: amidohydrolase family protein [Novosphingobium sp.]|nr:amidohydrolase family protein [Novosphingobium sp.]
MDILDSQVHLGPGPASEMVAAMDALGIRSVLVDEWWGGDVARPGFRLPNGAIRTSAPVTEHAAWTYPDRFSYLVRVYPDDPDCRAVIRFARDAPHARALRIAPGLSRDELDRFSSGAYDPIFSEAEAAGLPVFVTILGHAPLLERYARKFPSCNIIICHCGMPPHGDQWSAIAQAEARPDSTQYWQSLSSQSLQQAFDGVLRMSRFANLAIKWAHAPAYFGAAGYPNRETRPYLRQAIDAFGAERIMWASDFSTNQTGESWAELLFSIRENSDLSDDERSWILGRSARRYLAWDPAG